MRILLLCNKSPYPLREGGPIAMYAIISGLLKAGHQVKVLAANTNKYYVEPHSIPADFSDQTRIEFAYIDLSIKPLWALYNLIAGKSYHIARFRNRDFRKKLTRILKEESFDIIQCEMLYTTVYLDILRKYSKAPVILRAHNIEHLIWKRIAGNSLNPFRKFYINQLYLTLRKYELKILNCLDGVVAITGKDADFFRDHTGNTAVVSIPFGIDISDHHKVVENPGTPDLFNIGAMNWIPNAEGIRWFLESVWTDVRYEFPDLNIHLAGRMMPDWLLNIRQPGVIIEGEVPDAHQFISSHSVMIVPLFSGSGIRIKIIEAMAAGKAIITTSIGAEGINYVPGHHLLIADNKEQFIECIRKLIIEHDLRKQMGINARQLVLEEHDNAVLINQLTGFYRKISGNPPS